MWNGFYVILFSSALFLFFVTQAKHSEIKQTHLAIHHMRRERERMSASTIVTPFIKSPSMRNTHTEYCYLSVPSRALKWTFVCFVCQNNLQAFWPCYFMCTRVCSMLMHKKPVEKIKLQVFLFQCSVNAIGGPDKSISLFSSILSKRINSARQSNNSKSIGSRTFI